MVRPIKGGKGADLRPSSDIILKFLKALWGGRMDKGHYWVEKIIFFLHRISKSVVSLAPENREQVALLDMRLTQAQLLTMKSMLLSSFRKYSISFSKRCSSLHT